MATVTKKFTSLSAYLTTRKKLKQMALDKDMTIADLIDKLVDDAIEKDGGK